MKKKMIIVLVSSIMISLAFMPSLDADVLQLPNNNSSTNNKILSKKNHDTWVRQYDEGERDGAFQVLETNGKEYVILGSSSSYKVYTASLFIKIDEDGNIIWTRQLDDENYSGFKSFIKTNDEGFFFTGTKYFEDGDDIWLKKTDKNGNEQWNKTYDGENFGEVFFKNDSGYSSLETSDGGYIVLGVTQTGVEYWETNPIPIYDIWLFKVDQNGNKLWEKTFGESGDCEEYAGDIIQTKDGGYAILGETKMQSSSYSDYDVWLIKTDKDGNEQWDKKYDKFGSTEFADEVVQTKDGEFLILGKVAYSNNGGSWLIKTDENGNVLWDKVFKTGLINYNDLILNDDGTIILTGYDQYDTASLYQEGNALISKFDEYGNSLWKKIIVLHLRDSIICDGQRTNDGGYIFVGESVYKVGISYEYDRLLIKTDENGNANQNPNTPVIQGPNTGKILKTYTYKINISDQNNDNLNELQIVFGDGESGTITGDWKSGENIEVDHKWTKTGSFEIKSRVKDINETWSEWGKIQIKISKPRDRAYLPKIKGDLEIISFQKQGDLLYAEIKNNAKNEIKEDVYFDVESLFGRNLMPIKTYQQKIAFPPNEVTKVFQKLDTKYAYGFYKYTVTVAGNSNSSGLNIKNKVINKPIINQWLKVLLEKWDFPILRRTIDTYKN